MTENGTENPEIGRMIDVNGIATNIHDVGDPDSERTVVLLHGSGPGVSAWANWRPTIPTLSRSMRVIAPDILGFGYTERPSGIVYSPEGWLEHLVGVLDALDLERVSIVGNSFGGGLALRMAVAHPERVDRMVLMGSAGLSFTATEGLTRVYDYQPSVANMRALMDTFAYDQSLVTDELAALRYEASIRPGVQEAFESMFVPTYQEFVDRLAVGEEALATLSHETLVVHGREDQVIPVEASIRMFEALPNSQLHLFSRCGHWTQIEHAQTFNNLVVSFLSESEPR